MSLLIETEVDFPIDTTVGGGGNGGCKVKEEGSDDELEFEFELEVNKCKSKGGIFGGSIVIFELLFSFN